MVNDYLKSYDKMGYHWYEWNFQNLTQLYNYLKSNPKVPSKVFSPKYGYQSYTDKLMNYKEDNMISSFLGDITYDEAVEYLIQGYTNNYKKFLDLKKQITFLKPEYVEQYIYKKAVVGSHVHIANYVAGAPYCMIRREQVKEMKYVTIYFNLAIDSQVNESQNFNRGCLTLNLIKLLEKNGYRVKLNLIDFCYNKDCDEIIYSRFNLKKHNELLNERKCFFPFTSKSFERLICFKLLELTPVTNESWRTFGEMFKKEKCIELLNIKNDDIFISTPDDMNIKGYDLNEDAENFLNALNLEQTVKVLKK